jgi:hypothetical protein
VNALDLYRSLQGFLQFSSRLVSATGQDVNEGETFKVRLTVKNVAPAITLDDPVVIFTGLGYVVQGGPSRGLPRTLHSVNRGSSRTSASTPGTRRRQTSR